MVIDEGFIKPFNGLRSKLWAGEKAHNKLLSAVIIAVARLDQSSGRLESVSEGKDSKT